MLAPLYSDMHRIPAVGRVFGMVGQDLQFGQQETVGKFSDSGHWHGLDVGRGSVRSLGIAGRQ